MAAVVEEIEKAVYRVCLHHHAYSRKDRRDQRQAGMGHRGVTAVLFGDDTRRPNMYGAGRELTSGVGGGQCEPGVYRCIIFVVVGRSEGNNSGVPWNESDH